MIEDAVDLGANQVRDSGLLEMLAAEGVKPAHEWCEVRDARNGIILLTFIVRV